MPNLDLEIMNEIYTAFENLNAGSDLLSIIGSYRDTLSDKDILQFLKDYNAGGIWEHVVSDIDNEPSPLN